MRATLYYRGSLSSCNYDCPYCPFSKNVDNRETLAKDRRQLAEFAAWVKAQETAGHRLSIFFNPYGEALIHRWYRETMTELSWLPHVDKVAVQTNLSSPLDWTDGLNRRTAAFWATYHPGQTSEAAFVAQAQGLRQRKLRFSVGAVGTKKAIPAIVSLREALPPDVYVWVNAFKDTKRAYYDEAELARLRSVDPHFGRNLRDYDSLGRACGAGWDVFYVTGSGQVKRCYQDRRVIGHLYRDGLEGLAARRPCGMKQCGCYIGYIHMPELELGELYGDGLLERIPLEERRM